MKIKKLLSTLLIAAFACTSLASCTALAEKGNVATGELTYIGLRINPEIEMVADENGTIVSANAVNADGEVVLSEVELEGKTTEDAVVDFTETAVDLGFMDPEAGKDTVYVDVNGESTEVVEKVEKSLSDKLMKFFEKKGILGKVSKEVLDSYLPIAEELDVSVGHAKMLARVLAANPELTYDELLNLTVKELIELLKTETKDNNVTADLKDNYKDAVMALKEEYKEMFELREAIDDIEDDIEDAREEDDDDDDDDDDDKLTDEEIAALEAELAEKKAALEALEKEYKEKLAAIKAEFKASSDEAREEHKKEAEDRKQAKKEGKKYEDRDDDDKDEDRDDRDEHDDKDDRDDKHDKENKDDKGNKTDKPHHDDDDDDDEEDDD